MEGSNESGIGEGREVTPGGRGRGEIGGEAGEVTGVVANAPTTDGLGKRYGTFNGWGMAAGKVEVLLWLVGLMWTEVRKPDLSTKMSISRKVTWEGEIHYISSYYKLQV